MLKIAVISGVAAVTLGIHYGWLIEPIFGHVHWIHVVHGRFCYIPIVMAAAWFGLRGGLYTAGAISVLLLPYVFKAAGEARDLAVEMAEIIFYFAIAVLIGVLVEREFKARRKQQEAQLQVERTQKLSLAGQIAAGVAHEVKNPLATIKGAADILTDDDTSRAEREEFKEILQNEIKRIDTTVAEFLEFARPRETRLEYLNLTDTLRASLRQIENHARQRGLSIEARLQEDVKVRGDEEKLHQMMLNLVLNAVEASKKGDAIGVTLTKHNDSTRVEITDSGTGMDDADLKRIFEPFFTTKASGTGLGLAVVKTIVLGHGGDIAFESKKNHGTKVTVTLPLNPVGAKS
jgi:signal transduction histidine kinase